MRLVNPGGNLALFTAFAPLCLPRVNVLDGRQSIRRAYTPEEFRALIARALSGTGGSFRHSVAPSLRAASDGKPMPGVSDSLSSCIHWRIFGRQPKRTAAQAAVGLGGSGCRTALQGCQHL
jgi:hypothetical protein